MSATQLNILRTEWYVIFIYLVKMHALFSHTKLCVYESCVAAKGVMRFSCVASAAHFLFYSEFFSNICNFLFSAASCIMWEQVQRKEVDILTNQ